MASPLTKVPTVFAEPTGFSKVASQTSPSVNAVDPALPANFIQSVPCVVYECNLSLQLTYLSPNAHELIGIHPRSLLGTRAFWDERLLPEDLRLLCEKIEALKESDSASVLHRIIDDQGLPIWTSHGFRRLAATHSEVIRGCIVPLRNDPRIQDLQHSAVARFIHKLGNHFQLQKLIINSLQKSLPDSRETAVLDETVEKAIDLTRIFSEYCQSPTVVPIIDFCELIHSALLTRRASFAWKEIRLDQRLDDSLRGVMVHGDAYLLELALGSVLDNAFEATSKGGAIALQAKAELSEDNRSVVRLAVSDSGPGIEEKDAAQVTVPFFTSKKNHDGLGLSMAVRFIEMHGGLLTIKRGQKHGTEVQITLAAETSRQLTER
ncbi:MAG TPA: ATP-binding protein [Candidatus Binatia bacterium]|nr:ATP-binding protein [Candidatus Binatia bacterium]